MSIVIHFLSTLALAAALFFSLVLSLIRIGVLAASKERSTWGILVLFLWLLGQMASISAFGAFNYIFILPWFIEGPLTIAFLALFVYEFWCRLYKASEKAACHLDYDKAMGRHPPIIGAHR